uniref:HD2 protein n=1 Tax=Volvariella volvacea TaxID=36659 RepID=A0A1B2U728_9AGAR|nr:HD2 protein [Volvariella volvacea]
MDAKRQVLARLRSSAGQLKRKFSDISLDTPLAPATSTSTLQVAISQISFPEPTFPDRPSVLQMPEPWRRDTEKVFMELANRLRRTSMETLKSTFADLLNLYPRDQYLVVTMRLFETQLQNYNATIKRMEDRIVTLSLRLASQYTQQLDSSPTSRPSFKTEFTPLLERYFAQNAYPSAPDRTTLARKTGMTIRQIEVWFQNHRNRAKRNGKVLPRIPHRGSITALSPPQIEQTARPVEQAHACFSATYKLLPEYPLPPSVFPSKYRKKVDSQGEQHNILPYVWPRRPAATACEHASFSLDQLGDDLGSKLHLRDDDTGSLKRKIRPLPRRIYRQSISTPAPLPSLIPHKVHTYRLPTAFPSTRAQASMRRAAFSQYQSSVTVSLSCSAVAEASPSSLSLLSSPNDNQLPLPLVSQVVSSSRGKVDPMVSCVSAFDNFIHQLDRYMLLHSNSMQQPLCILGQS